MSGIRDKFKDIAETLFNNAISGLSDGRPQLSAQKVFFSICYGPQRAKTVKGIGGTLRAAFDAALERALKIVSQNEALPKWVLVNVVEKEISCPAAEYYDILNRIKPGYLRYGVSFDNRYATVFLEQEINAASMIKYGGGGYTLDAAKITDYIRIQSGGATGVTFSAPKADSPVVLFEVKSRFYDSGEYFEIDSSPASLRAGLRIVNFEEKPELRVETARKVVAACFTADCAAINSADGFAATMENSADNPTGVDNDALFSAALPAVMFPEMAMFFTSPETVAYGAFVRGKNFDERDSVAVRFFTDYYNRHKNKTLLNGDTGTKSKIITTRYNPYAHKIAESYGLAADEFENMYDFFQNSVQTETREIGPDEVEQLFPTVKREGWKDIYTHQKAEYADNPKNVGYKVFKKDVCEAYAHYENGVLSYISYYDLVKKREKRAIYDCRGFISCKRLMNEERLVMSEEFLTPAGELTVEKTYRVEDGHSDIMVVRVKYDGTWRCFSDEEEFLAFYWDISARLHGDNGRQVATHNTDKSADSGRQVNVHTDKSAVSQETPKETASEKLAISIIIPHYNRAELIMMCLDSIAVNDYPQELYEVIVVDDCSTENIDAVRNYSKIKNFHVYQLEKNSGVASVPRNYGIAKAVGEYALFIDSDDMISARLLSESMRIAQAGDCDAVIIPKISQRFTAAAFRTLTDDLTKIKLDTLSDLSVLVASDNYAIGKLFRMDLVRQFGIRFPETLKFSEDTCFCRWFYAVSKTMGVCASESYFLRDWDEGTLSHHAMSNNEMYEHVSFITRNIFSIPDEFAPIDRKARAIDSSMKLDAVRAMLGTPYYTALLNEKYGKHFAAMRNAPRISNETREFIDKVALAKPIARNRDKLEIVFMPYRASTWDSLESIWLAAKNDPDCNVYVVPLPYRDPGSGELISDAESFPYYVPITAYGDYDFCERLPDIVYINDPYDQYREIAPIDDKYHSYNLKKYTGMMVYVPYYGTLGAMNPDTEVYKALIYVSKHVDKVITQSEKFSEFYAKDASANKFAALGSPKMDKLINAKKENYALPEEWRKIIGDKKIILYNTHLVNIRDPKRDMIAKLRYVISVFEKRADVVLWWRPHPSIEVELKTRNPQGFDAYRRLVEEYKAAGIGIYDDTPDLHRALVWSDAYYGDYGSLIRMCGVVGKPIMIQDAVMKNENSGVTGKPAIIQDVVRKNENFYNIQFFEVYDDGENFWFTAAQFNALFKMDKQNWVAEYMGSFPNEINRGRLYSQITEHGGKLYFTPAYANEIGVYDIAAGRFEKISFARDDYNAPRRYEFHATVAYGKHILFLGCLNPSIMRLDTESERIDYFTDWVKLFAGISEGTGPYFWGVCISGNKIFMPTMNTNAVVAFDMDRCVSQLYEAGSKGQKYGEICFDGENYWLVPLYDGAIVKWNPDTNECNEYSGYPAGFEFGKPDVGINFGAITFVDGYIWLLPWRANMAIKINVLDGSMSAAEEFMDECNCEGEEVFKWNYYISLAAGDKLYARTGKTNRFIEYDFKTKQRREEGIALSQETVQKLSESNSALFYINIKRRLSVNGCNFRENQTRAVPSLKFDTSLARVLSLQGFLKYLYPSLTWVPSLQGFLNYVVTEFEGKAALSAKQIEAYGTVAANLDGTCGAKIHECVKKEVPKPNQDIKILI